MLDETGNYLPKIFADSSKISEIEQLIQLGIIHGITTNPLIVAKEAGNSEPINYYRKLVEEFPELPISIQLLDHDLETLLEEARSFASISPNIVIKVPMFSNGRGLALISQLSSEGIKTNVTGLMKAEQLFLSLLAGKSKGPHYVSLFFNRIKDGGGDPKFEIQRSRKLLDQLSHQAEIIVGSIRQGSDVFEAALAGGNIVTVTPKVIWEMVEHIKTTEFINQCQQSWDELIKSQKIKKPENGKIHPASN